MTKKQEQRLNLQIVEEYGGDDGTRTRGLCRDGAGMSSTLNNLQGLLGTAKYLILPSSRTDLGLAVGFKTNSSRPLYEDAAELGVCEHLS